MYKKDVVVDQLVWWKASRKRYGEWTESWDCPGIIKEVTKVGFRIMTLDEFEESNPTWAGGDDGPAHKEMRIPEPEEVAAYLNKQKDEYHHDSHIQEMNLKIKLNTLAEEGKTYDLKVAGILAKHVYTLENDK